MIRHAGTSQMKTQIKIPSFCAMDSGKGSQGRGKKRKKEGPVSLRAAYWARNVSASTLRCLNGGALRGPWECWVLEHTRPKGWTGTGDYGVD